MCEPLFFSIFSLLIRDHRPYWAEKLAMRKHESNKDLDPHIKEKKSASDLVIDFI